MTESTLSRLLRAGPNEERLRRPIRPEEIRRGFPDAPPPDDPEGGAGVREPRRPRPTMPAAAMELEPPTAPSDRSEPQRARTR